MHHAYSGGGAGWCMFSDLTLALRKIRKASQGSVSKIMIIDTDVHQVLQQSVQCMKL
jgi:acetoin utilization deacetylase AcuC-like enzyme